jgi:hypothetical protein
MSRLGIPGEAVLETRICSAPSSLCFRASGEIVEADLLAGPGREQRVGFAGSLSRSALT